MSLIDLLDAGSSTCWIATTIALSVFSLVCHWRDCLVEPLSDSSFSIAGYCCAWSTSFATDQSGVTPCIAGIRSSAFATFC